MKPRRKILINPDTLVLLKQIGIGLLVLTLVGILITAIWYGTRTEALTVSQVVVTGGETINHEQVKIIVQEELKGNYLGLIPKQFAWFYPAVSIKTELSKIERIYNINLVVEDTKLKVTFDEYLPFALWCADVDSKDCLFVDSQGYAFATAPDLDGGSFLRFSKLGEGISLQSNITNYDDFIKLMELKGLLETRDWFISHIEIDKEDDAFLMLTPGSELKVTLKQTALETVENLFTVLSSEQFVDLAPGNFDYIDLRYGNKVFVKVEETLPVEEVVEEVATSTVKKLPAEVN
jgi:cell division septal protein FtsQ